MCGFVILLVAAFPPFVPNLLISLSLSLSLSLSHHTFLSNEGESYGFGEINIGVFNWFLINPPPPTKKKPGPHAPAMAWRSNPVCLQLRPSDLDFPIQIRNLSTIALKIQWTNSPSPSPPPPKTNKLESVCIVWFLRKSKINIKTSRKWDIQTQKP